MLNLGIMQGRFTNKGGFFPQRFPWSGWEDEFAVAEAEEIVCIEWMFNYEKYESNPLIIKDGQDKINLIQQGKVKVRSVCANYYMAEALFKGCGLEIFDRLCNAMVIVGAEIAVIPIFEDNEPKDDIEEKLLIDALRKACKIGFSHGIRIAIETDWNIDKVICIADDVTGLSVCYDIGNAVGLGKDPVKDIRMLGNRVIDVHLKDKTYGGSSVMLGEGDADFVSIITELSKLRYNGNLILESYFGENAMKDTHENIEYIRRISA